MGGCLIDRFERFLRDRLPLTTDTPLSLADATDLLRELREWACDEGVAEHDLECLALFIITPFLELEAMSSAERARMRQEFSAVGFDVALVN